LKTTVIGCKAKHKLSKKWFPRGNSGCKTGVLGKEKGGHLLFSRKTRQKTPKDTKYRSTTKKRSSEIQKFGALNGNFSLKRVFRKLNLVREFFFVLPNSMTSLRPWVQRR